MKSAAWILFIVFFCGCIGEHQPTTTQKTSTTTTYQDPLTDVVESATQYLKLKENLTSRNCTKILLKESSQLTDSQRILTFTCECDNSLYKFHINVFGDEVMGYELVDVEKLCLVDAECVPEKPSEGMRYFCEQRTCKAKAFIDEASVKCGQEGGIIKMRKISGLHTYVVCIFENGNECEIWAHYFGRCDNTSANLTDCSGYELNNLCALDYTPVCAKLISARGQDNYSWKGFSNGCSACKISTKDEYAEGYVIGTCPITTTTTLKSPDLTSAAEKYCRDLGYSYKIRQYASGNEYGVCVFGYDNECNAEDFFHGRCMSKD